MIPRTRWNAPRARARRAGRVATGPHSRGSRTRSRSRRAMRRRPPSRTANVLDHGTRTGRGRRVDLDTVEFVDRPLPPAHGWRLTRGTHRVRSPRPPRRPRRTSVELLIAYRGAQILVRDPPPSINLPSRRPWRRIDLWLRPTWSRSESWRASCGGGSACRARDGRTAGVRRRSDMEEIRDREWSEHFRSRCPPRIFRWRPWRCSPSGSCWRRRLPAPARFPGRWARSA